MGQTLRAAALAVVLAACPPVPVSDAGVDAGSAADRHCTKYSEASCTRLAACGTAEPSQSASCEERAFDGCHATIAPRSRAGATLIEPGATEACLTAIANAPCIFVESIARSNCVFAPGTRVPAGVPGSPCETWESCLEGICAPPSSGPSRCGVCSAAARVGERCGACDPRVAFCSGASTCDAYFLDGAACVRLEQCQSRICNLRQRCGPAQRGERCRSEFECSRDDFCFALVPNQVPGSCQPRVELGAPCPNAPWDATGGCAQGSWCLDGSCVAPDAGSLADGAQCSNHVQCVEGAVCEGLAAFQFGRCATPRLNGPCVAGFCPAEGRCINVSSGASCRPLKGLDEPCTLEDPRWDDCRVGLAAGTACTAKRCV